ncbi:MAG: hypothetical protein RLZ25_1889 [Pseudomonadota bacterium]
MRYRPDIDGLRALSVLGVMIYHLDHAWLPGGFTGVDVFFVISGFVVTGAMEDRGQDRFWGFIADFYARRLARIIPALVLTLTITSLLDVLFIPVSWLSDRDETLGLAAFFGISNWVLQQGQETYFTPRVDYNPYLHTWSLGVEEQFYLLAPLLLFFALKPARSVWRLGGVSILFVLALTSLGMSIDATSQMPPLAFYSIFTRFFELATGVLLFLLTRGKQASKFQVFGRLSGFVGIFLILTALGWADESRMPWPFALIPVVGTLLLIGGAQLEPKGLVRRILATSPGVWLGKRSYALYLWHWPVDVVLRWTVGLESVSSRMLAIVVSILLAAISSAWIEKPLRHHPFLEQRPPVVRILFFLALVGAGAWFSKLLFDHRARFSFSQVARHDHDWYMYYRMRSPALGSGQCAVKLEKKSLAFGQLTRYEPEDCRQGKSKRTLFVVGDSHALMLAGLFDQASSEFGLRVNLLSLEGCPYLNFRTLLKDREPECRGHYEPLKDYLLQEGRPGDVILMANLMLMRYADQNERYPIPDMAAYLYGGQFLQQAPKVYAEISEILRAYRNRGLKIMLWAPPPIFKSPSFRCSDWFNRQNPICEGGLEMQREELEALREPILLQMHQLEGPAITVLDAFPILCPEPICRVKAPNGRPLFFDGDHLSRYGNEVIYPTFKALLGQMGVHPERP